MPPSEPSNPSNPIQKHRACDECRSRKLACSKEESGCSRCLADGTACTYSRQKTMGRPKKRKRTEQPGTEADTVQQATTIPAPQELLVADCDFSLLDECFGAWDGGFLLANELLGDALLLEEYQANDVPLCEPQAAPSTQLGPEAGSSRGVASTAEKGVAWHFGIDALQPNVDFSTVCSDLNKGTPHTPPSPLATASTPTLFLAQENDPDPLAPRQEETNPPIPCSCLSSLYLALSSLQVLPADTTLAMSTIRQAAYTAHVVTRCQICTNCRPATADAYPPPISLQNNMLLGTLLPIIADGYKRLLKMIDDRCAAALALPTTFQGESKIAFDPYGCGSGTTITALTCPARDFEMREMEPREWRTTMRALLRGDVYGIDGGHGGLKGLIGEVEGRQRRKHEELDRLAGEKEGGREASEDVVRDRTCERILDIARAALERLVIA